MESGRTLDSLETRSSLQQLATIDPQKHAILQQLDKKKRARTVAVPTDDAKVRICLRAFLQPITLFGEGPYDRRERLKAFLADRGETGVPADFLQEPGVEMEEEEEEEDDNEEFFTHGTEELVEARIWLASYSLPRSKQRLESQQLESQTSLAEAKNKRKSVYLGMKQTGLYGTQICGDRPLSACAIAPDSQTLATGCFGGSVKLWSLPNCTPLDSSYKGHHERITNISWHPRACLGQSSEAVNFCSGAADGSIHLWNLVDDEPIQSLDGHDVRAAPFFHPSGRFIGTASFDCTWRLWDVETGDELLLQEGHSREVMALSFQWDGALVASGGMDGFGRIWDLRTGRSIMLLEGHVQPVLSLDFNPSGYEVITASSDNSLRVHDLRKLKSSLHIIPAHTNIVSAIKFRYQYQHRPSNSMDCASDGEGYSDSLGSYYGDCMVSASFDGTAKIWGVGDWRLLKTLAGHESKIMDVDISNDGTLITTAAYDRTVKVWTRDAV